MKEQLAGYFDNDMLAGVGTFLTLTSEYQKAVMIFVAERFADEFKEMLANVKENNDTDIDVSTIDVEKIKELIALVD